MGRWVRRPNGRPPVRSLIGGQDPTRSVPIRNHPPFGPRPGGGVGLAGLTRSRPLAKTEHMLRTVPSLVGAERPNILLIRPESAPRGHLVDTWQTPGPAPTAPRSRCHRPEPSGTANVQPKRRRDDPHGCSACRPGHTPCGRTDLPPRRRSLPDSNRPRRHVWETIADSVPEIDSMVRCLGEKSLTGSRSKRAWAGDPLEPGGAGPMVTGAPCSPANHPGMVTRVQS